MLSEKNRAVGHDLLKCLARQGQLTQGVKAICELKFENQRAWMPMAHLLLEIA